MRNLAVFASGTGTNFEAIAEACSDGRLDARVVLMVCDKPQAPVVEKARKRGIETFVFKPRDYASKVAFEAQIVSELDSRSVDLVCLAGYMRIVGETLLDAYGGRIINIHPSLLPAFKGANAVEQAFEYGVKVYGVSIHYVDSTLDGGRIIAQRAFPYEGNDLEELHAMGHQVEYALYVDTIRALISRKRVLVIGGGGREHAIVDALSRSPKVEKIYCAPGNAGTSLIATNVAIKDTDVEGIRKFALDNAIDLVVVGPEAALAAGVADVLREAGIPVFGHTAKATRIESSKEFAKMLMERSGIPTASYKSFDSYEEASAYVNSRPFPAVLKYDGLAAGKGVVIAQDAAEADAALRSMLLDESFGKGRVVVEDFLTGPEFSLMCFVNGSRVVPMPVAQDHKRAYDGDKGPNTGGMGAYTGLPFIDDDDRRFAMDNIMQRAADAMAAEGCPLSGVLYGGLMKTPDGIKVIEFNARFGDPETEVVLPLLKSDAYDIFESFATGRPLDGDIKWDNAVTMGVVMASKGYPGSYAKGFEIEGTQNVTSKVFHMGTRREGDKLLTAGGRVLMCVATAADMAAARDAVYADIASIGCSNLFYRKDIAHIAFEYNTENQ